MIGLHINAYEKSVMVCVVLYKKIQEPLMLELSELSKSDFLGVISY